MITRILSKYGNEEQKELFLKLLSTSQVGSFCLSESESGSDAFALKTTAKQVGNDEFILNGSKMWISNAKEAGVFLVFANVNPELGYKGITCFVFDKSDISEGSLSIGKKEQKVPLTLLDFTLKHLILIFSSD